MKLTKTSIQRLRGVHPKLVSVVLLACLNSDFRINVSEGVRSKERQIQMFNEEKSKTKNGKHLIQSDGYGHAVDLYPITDDGKAIDWNGFQKLVGAMKSAAADLGVTITCGHEWTSFKDSPHFELKS